MGRKPTSMDLESTDANTLFLSAGASKDKSLAKRVEIEVEIFNGTLLKIGEVERGVFSAGRLLRDQLLNLSKRIAPELVGINNVAKLEQKLTLEIKKVIKSTSLKLRKDKLSEHLTGNL